VKKRAHLGYDAEVRLRRYRVLVGERSRRGGSL
jgi:hypothetical protein